MTKLFFSIPNCLTIKVSSDKDLVFGHNELLILKGYIPNVVKLETEPSQIDLVFEHTESEEKKLIQKDNNIHIFDTWRGAPSDDLYHLLYGMVRVQLLKRKLFPIHGACVGKDDYVLIIGHSGTGKTSVVMKLLEDKNIKIFSEDKTVVSFDSGKIIAIAGTPTISMRDTEKNKLGEQKISDYVELWGRYFFTLSPEKYETRQSVDIKAIVMMRLNDHIRECKEISLPSSLHSLYPLFMDAVNADIVVSDANDAFIGVPPEGAGKYLVGQLKIALKSLPVYLLIGTSDYIANEIVKL